MEDRDAILSEIAAAADAGAAAVVLFWGDPAPFVPAAHAGGLKVLIQVGSVEEAESAVVAGVDAVIAQGIEAGGHVRGTTSIWELIPRTVEAVSPTPVLASGGIGDGAGLARALELGAQGVSLGTRFVASDEAYVHAAYKQRVVSGDASETVLTPDLFDVDWPGAPHRTLRNRIHEEWEAAGRPPSGKKPGQGTAIGRNRNSSGEIEDWQRYTCGTATPEFDSAFPSAGGGARARGKTAISSTPLCGLVSQFRSSTTSSRRERSSRTWSDRQRPRLPRRPRRWVRASS